MNSKFAISMIPFLFVWLWSTGFVGARFGLPYIEPFFMLSVRFSITIPCFILLILIFKRNWLTPNQIGVQMFVGILLHGLYLGGVFYAISIGTPAGIAAIIVGLQPILTSTINWVVFRETISGRQIIGLLLGFLGLLAVIYGSTELTGSEHGRLGLLVCIVSLVAISVSTIVQKRYASGTPLIAGSMWQNVGALCVVVLASTLVETQTYTAAWQLVAALAWLIFALSILAILLLMYMIREGEVAKVTSYFYLVPPVAVFQTWLLFDEKLSVISLFGCLIVVVGVALVVRQKN